MENYLSWSSAKLDEGPNCGILRVLVPTPIKDKVVFTYSKAQNKEFGSEEWTIKRGCARDKSKESLK